MAGSGIAGLLVALVTPRLARPGRLRVKAFKLIPRTTRLRKLRLRLLTCFPDSRCPLAHLHSRLFASGQGLGVELAYPLVCLRRQLLACSLYTHRYIHFRLNFIRTDATLDRQQRFVLAPLQRFGRAADLRVLLSFADMNSRTARTCERFSCGRAGQMRRSRFKRTATII